MAIATRRERQFPPTLTQGIVTLALQDRDALIKPRYLALRGRLISLQGLCLWAALPVL